MPVPLPPALVGSIFLPRPCTSVGQSVRPATAPAQLKQGWFMALGWGSPALPAANQWIRFWGGEGLGDLVASEP